MILKNLQKITRTYVINNTEVSVPPLGQSADLILSEDDIRLIHSTSKGKIEFVVTNPSVETKLLANAGVTMEELSNESVEESEPEAEVKEEETPEVEVEGSEEPQEDKPKKRRRRSKKSE